MLRKIRIAAAIIVCFCLTLYIIDMAGLLPHKFYCLAMWQFLPAAIAHSILIVGIILAITLLFGRIYCSVLCPMGVFQDAIIWISNRKIFKRLRRNRGSKPQAYRKPKTWLRVSVLVLAVVCLLLDLTLLLAIIEPYSAYTRIATHLFRPLYMWGNNVLETITSSLGIHTFFKVEVFVNSLLALIVSAITFIVIVFLSWRYGRSFCSTICPTGTILGFVNRGSLLKVRIDKDKCTNCGLCSYKCKAHCIDSKNSRIDYSRCVSCFNCTGVCKQKAIKYSMPVAFGSGSTSTVASTSAKEDTGRRKFIATAAILPLLNVKKLFARTAGGDGIPTADAERTVPIAPPGAQSHHHLLKHCTSCHLCVDKCPSRVLKPAFLEYGIGGIMQPVMNFEKGFCNYDCTVCTEVCPNDALKPLTIKEKHETQVGKVVFIKERCIVYANETSCGACSEHCPTQAVTMVDYKNGLTIPKIDTSICAGCGGCEHICPVRPHRAIFIEGNPVHQKAQAIKEQEQDNVKIDNFGF